MEVIVTVIMQKTVHFHYQMACKAETIIHNRSYNRALETYSEDLL